MIHGTDEAACCAAVCTNDRRRGAVRNGYAARFRHHADKSANDFTLEPRLHFFRGIDRFDICEVAFFGAEVYTGICDFHGIGNRTDERTDVLAAFINPHAGKRHVFDLTVKCTEQTCISVLRSFFDVQV